MEYMLRLDGGAMEDLVGRTSMLVEVMNTLKPVMKAVFIRIR